MYTQTGRSNTNREILHKGIVTYCFFKFLEDKNTPGNLRPLCSGGLVVSRWKKLGRALALAASSLWQVWVEVTRIKGSHLHWPAALVWEGGSHAGEGDSVCVCRLQPLGECF